MMADFKLFLFETNDTLFEKQHQINDSRAIFYDESVEFVKKLPPKEVDFIISGIPFSFLDDETKASVLEQSYKLLREGGKFLAYQTSGHLKEPLQETFGNVKTEWEWRNIPSLTAYEAVKK